MCNCDCEGKCGCCKMHKYYFTANFSGLVQECFKNVYEWTRMCVNASECARMLWNVAECLGLCENVEMGAIFGSWISGEQ